MVCMADRLTREKRSWNMSHIRSKDTGIEVKVRKFLFSKGYRYRKNDSKLPGKPDIVLPKYKTVIFVHGCYWHRHPGCKNCTTPSTNTDFWIQKFNKNVACGVSLVIDNEEKMEELLTDYDDEIYVEKRSLQEAIIEQQNLKNPMKRPKERNNCIRVMFDSNASLADFLKACNLPWKEDFKYKTIKMAKNIIYSLRLYNVYKTVIYKLGK